MIFLNIIKISAIEIPIVWYAFSYKQKNNIWNTYTNDTIETFMNGVLPSGISFSIDTLTTKCTFLASFSFSIDFSVGSLAYFKRLVGI